MLVHVGLGQFVVALAQIVHNPLVPQNAVYSPLVNCKMKLDT